MPVNGACVHPESKATHAPRTFLVSPFLMRALLNFIGRRFCWIHLILYKVALDLCVGWVSGYVCLFAMAVRGGHQVSYSATFCLMSLKWSLIELGSRQVASKHP